MYINARTARATATLRELLKKGRFIYMPAVYYPLGGRLVEHLGFPAAYVGGYVTGASRAVTEPLLTLTEQVETAALVATCIRFSAAGTMSLVRSVSPSGVATR